MVFILEVISEIEPCFTHEYTLACYNVCAVVDVLEKLDSQDKQERFTIG